MSWGQTSDQEPDGWEIIQDSFEREDRDMSNPEVANINYVRGVAHALLAVEAVKQVQDDGGDITSGAEVRQAIFDMDDFDARGLIPVTLNYMEGDRRATMWGQTYQVSDAEIVAKEEIQLERREEWLP
jgi:branched-chain amino acid transport system substrate-binding protein